MKVGNFKTNATWMFIIKLIYKHVVVSIPLLDLKWIATD